MSNVDERRKDPMTRLNGIIVVAKCFASKGIESDDDPVWIAAVFAALLDLIEKELDQVKAALLAEEARSAHAEANPADDRPAA